VGLWKAHFNLGLTFHYPVLVPRPQKRGRYGLIPTARPEIRRPAQCHHPEIDAQRSIHVVPNRNSYTAASLRILFSLSPPSRTHATLINPSLPRAAAVYIPHFQIPASDPDGPTSPPPAHVAGDLQVTPAPIAQSNRDSGFRIFFFGGVALWIYTTNRSVE
jgi:hypothetical protein